MTADLQSALVAAGERPSIYVVAPDGFEPPLQEPESGVLPLHQGAMCAEAKGFEPLRHFCLSVFKTDAIDQLCQTSIVLCDEGGSRTHNLMFRGHLL